MGIFDIFAQIEKEKGDTDEKSGGSIEYIIVGLGNPGVQYENTRHNAGFMVVDTLAQKKGITLKKLKFKSLTGEATVGGKRCLIMKPQTFMNNSGEAVSAAMSYYKLSIERLIVCYDDISLEPSKLRIRRKGTDGGHNGIKSIIYLTGEDNFPRIKVGVGAKPHPEYNLADWVLSSFSAEEIPKIREAADNACEALELMTAEKIEQAMNKYN